MEVAHGRSSSARRARRRRGSASRAVAARAAARPSRTSPWRRGRVRCTASHYFQVYCGRVNRGRAVTRPFAAGLRPSAARCEDAAHARSGPLRGDAADARAPTRALVVLAALALAVSALALYAERMLFDSARFADRVEVALTDAGRRARGRRHADGRDRPRETGPDRRRAARARRRRAGRAQLAVPLARRPRRLRGARAVFDRERDSAVLIVGNGALLVTQALEQADPAAAQQFPPQLENRARLAGGGQARAGVRRRRAGRRRTRGLASSRWCSRSCSRCWRSALTPRAERSRTVARSAGRSAVVGVAADPRRRGRPRADRRPRRHRPSARTRCARCGRRSSATSRCGASRSRRRGLVLVAAATSRASEPTLARRVRALALRIAARPQALGLRVVRALALLVLGALIALRRWRRCGSPRSPAACSSRRSAWES